MVDFAVCPFLYGKKSQAAGFLRLILPLARQYYARQLAICPP